MAATPDPDLLREVADAIDQHGRDVFLGPGWLYDEGGAVCCDSPLARVALAATGRLLGERLDEFAGYLDVGEGVERMPMHAMKRAASEVRRLCGTPLPTEGGGRE